MNKSIIVVGLLALALVCSVMFFVSTPTTYGTPSTHEPRDHKGTPDPCKALGNCGPGDHGQGNPTKAQCNPNASQGEPECPAKATNAPDNTKTPPTDVPRATSTSVPRYTPGPTVTDDPPTSATPQPHTVVTPQSIGKYTPSIGCQTIKCGCLATIVVTETTTVWANRGITQTLRVTVYTYQSGSGLTR